jgi:hypothetical protein
VVTSFHSDKFSGDKEDKEDSDAYNGDNEDDNTDDDWMMRIKALVSRHICHDYEDVFGSLYLQSKSTD